ncbi:MAG TPA: DUF805 domain-containing protein [Ramlibacter sp.]|jgi:uncharacterized membrane protein YhaH (DUF805 family)|nr:DUF805 domain-containing protein [Ramlibacter sp.]
MTFTDAVKTCFQKFATFTGRAGRPEFWWFFLFQVIVNVATGMVSAVLSMLVSFAFLVPGLAVGARRMHDIGKSGWLQLLWLVPFIGWAIMIYWLVQPSTPANEHGDAAEAPASSVGIPGIQ